MPLNNGDPVSLWPDSTGNGHDATQSVGANRPTFAISVANGRPAVLFVGANQQYFTLASAIPADLSGQPFTVIAVMQNLNQLYGLSNYTSGNNACAAPRLYGGGGNVIVQTAGLIRFGSAGITSNFEVYTATSAPATYKGGTGGATTGNYGGIVTSDFNAIGSDLGSGQWGDGYICEICVYNSVLSPTNQANVEKGLAAKYGCAVAGGTAVDPTSVGGLEAWFKAESLGGVSGMPVPMDTWLDNSGHGHDGVQTGDNRPGLFLNVLNGQPVVRFVNQWFNLASVISGATPYTCLTVMRAFNGAIALATLGGNDTNGYLFNLLENTDGHTYWGDRVGYNHYDFSFGGSFHVLSVTANGAGVGAIWDNGTSLAVTGSAALGNSADWAYIGGRANLGEYGNGDIAEILFFNVILSSTNRANLEAYLGARLGLTVTSGGTPVDPSTVSGLVGWWKATTPPIVATATDALQTAESAIRALGEAHTAHDALATAESAGRVLLHRQTITDALSTAENVIASRVHIFLAGQVTGSSLIDVPSKTTSSLDVFIQNLNDGDTVITWPDSSGNGNNGTKIGAPKFKVSIVGGKPVVRLTSASSDGFILTTPISGADPWTLFVVMKAVSSSSVLVAAAAIGNRTPYLLEWSSANLIMTSRDTYYQVGDYSGAFHVFVVSSAAGGTGKIIIDGINTGVVGTVYGPYAGNFEGIGYRGFGPSYSDGDIAEIGLYNLDISSTSKANLAKGLGVKYGITIAGGTGVDPSSISGLQGWWKADSMLARRAITGSRIAFSVASSALKVEKTT